MKFVVSFLFILISSILFSQQKTIDSLIQVTESDVHDTIRIKAFQKWDALIYASDPEKDLELNREVVLLCKKAINQKKAGKKEKKFYYKSLSEAYSNIGLYFADKGNYDKSFEYYDKIYQLGIESNDYSLQARSFMNKGRTMRFKGDLPEAIKFCQEGIKLEEKAGNGSATSTSYNLLGNLYRGQGDFPKALQYFQKAMTAAEKQNSAVDKANALLNYGLVHYELIDYKTAEKYYLQSLDAFQNANYDKGTGVVLINIANIKQINKEYDSALFYYEKGIIILKKLNDIRSEIGALSNMGIVYNRTGNYAKALEFMNKVYEKRVELEDKIGQSFSLSQLGEVYINLKQFSKAIENCQKGYQLALEANSLPEQRDNCVCLYKSYKLNGNATQSLKFYETYVQLKDSLTDVDQSNEIARLEERFKNKKLSEADSVRNLEKEKVQKAETEKQKALADSRDSELKSKKMQQYFLFGGLAVVLLFSVILWNRFKESQRQKRLIENKERETNEQKLIIEEKQKEIIDSINYAKRIQYALLANSELMEKNLKEHFVLFQPKDIVSGDFYWATVKQSGNGEYDFYLAVCDSTGHGVPGAFMSLLNISFLNEAINEKNITEPNQVLNHVRNRLIENVEDGKDGMDAQLICISDNKVKYAAAHNKPLLIRKGSVQELQADKMPVGRGERTDSFSLFEINIEKGDLLLLTTDGFADQFGGPKGKKFKNTRLQSLVCELSTKPVLQMKDEMLRSFESWKGNLEQIDDVCVIGIRF